jgi:hypothetical protein
MVCQAKCTGLFREVFVITILVHTWWFSRYKGSEFSVAYNFVTEMSRYHHLYVIVESCSYQFGDYSEFSEYSIENCEFIFIKPDFLTRFFDLLHKHGTSVIAAWSSYLAFNLWERQLYRYIKKASFFDSIDLIHYLGPVGYHEPGYLYRLNKPYIWGPVSGFENVNRELLNHYLSGKALIRIKNILNTITLYCNMRLKSVMKKADIVIAATKSNKKIIEKIFDPRFLLYFPENLMRITENEIISENSLEEKYTNINRITIVWCGSLVSRKMPNMLIDSISQCKNQDKFDVLLIGALPAFLWVKI